MRVKYHLHSKVTVSWELEIFVNNDRNRLGFSQSFQCCILPIVVLSVKR